MIKYYIFVGPHSATLTADPDDKWIDEDEELVHTFTADSWEEANGKYKEYMEYESS